MSAQRTADIVTAAAPMPGLEADNILVEVTAGGRLVLRGSLRGALKDVKERLVEEWSAASHTRTARLRLQPVAPTRGERVPS
jgi:HSP20 family protein